MNYSSVFIHLSPSLISWSFRWFTSDVIAAYPSIFKPMSVAAVESVTLVDMLNPFVCVYMAWMVPYTIWLWCGGMYESPDTTGRETSWHAQVRQCICILRIHSLGGCHFSWGIKAVEVYGAGLSCVVQCHSHTAYSFLYIFASFYFSPCR